MVSDAWLWWPLENANDSGGPSSFLGVCHIPWMTFSIRYMMGLRFPIILFSSSGLRVMMDSCFCSSFASSFLPHNPLKCHTKLCLYLVACSTCQLNVIWLVTQGPSLGLLSCYLTFFRKFFYCFDNYSWPITSLWILQTCHNMPEQGRDRPGADGFRPMQTCLQGSFGTPFSTN